MERGAFLEKNSNNFVIYSFICEKSNILSMTKNFIVRLPPPYDWLYLDFDEMIFATKYCQMYIY